MKRALLVAAAVSLAVAAYPAYADDYVASVQNVIDAWTDVRNDYLAESFFGKSYPTPQTAAVETVNGAIDLYESTRADPHVQVTQRGTFVQHPTNPYGTTVVAFEVINAMGTGEEVYPFVIDAGTLKVLAEGAFPGTVGLSATFLHDADRPLKDILADLQESDGTWVSYIFNNPNTGMYESKHTWLSLYDGYIFGAGYYEQRDDGVLDSVAAMVGMYDTSGDESFAGIPAAPWVSFVLDAGTLDIVAHTASGISGSDIRDAIDANWPLETVSDILSRHGSMWLSYASPDPRPGSEFVRAHLQLHDGHIFGSGYGLTPEARVQSLVDETIQLYDMEGEDAFPIITSLDGTRQMVQDAGSNTILASSKQPRLVGQTADASFLDQKKEVVIQYLRDHAGLWTDRFFVNTRSSSTVEEQRVSSWVVLHKGHLFSAAHVYSPEAVTIETVNAAIALYKAHGEEAFDRITWQSVRPEIIYPFAHVAQTWELVAHAAVPERVGVCCAAPIAASNDLDAASRALEQNPGIWLEYTFYNPISERYEYKRAWFSTYDGYTFAAGYYYGNVERLENTIQEAIDLYDAEGQNAAFASVNAMKDNTDYSIILDGETLDVVAHGQNPGLVGTNFLDGVVSAPSVAGKIEAGLRSDGDTTFAAYSTQNPATGSLTTRLILLHMHDGYIFAAEQPFVIYTR